jgi:hypothetical protein
MAACNICCEKYNKSLNAKITCEFSGCGYEACKTCIRTYLLGTTNDPHCMNCKNPWPAKFLVDNLNRSYIENDFKKHRKNLLVEKEISRTPELMNLVQRTRLLEESLEQLKELEKKFAEARKVYNSIYQEVSEKKLEIYRIKNGEDTKEERKKFIMPCPADNCKGYLSTQYKCEVCKLFTCPDCFEVIGYSKEEHHECKEDNLKSAEMIKKETKGCPKCGVRIFKISGCDQMWCTECKVAFSWNTGKIVLNGQIHNPHYYNYLQQTEGGVGAAPPRNPGDIVCGGLIPYYSFNSITRWISRFSQSTWFDYLIRNSSVISDYFEMRKIDTIVSFVNEINQIHRHINHITNVDLINCRNKVRNLQNHDYDTVQYILNNKTKTQLADIIFKNDIQRKKYNELLNIYELLSVVGVERIRSIYDYYIGKMAKEKNDCIKIKNLIFMFVEFLSEYNKLIDYVNKQLMIISYTYNLTVNIYYYSSKDRSWIPIGKKFKQVDILKIDQKEKDNFKTLDKGKNNSEASCSYD